MASSAIKSGALVNLTELHPSSQFYEEGASLRVTGKIGTKENAVIFNEKNKIYYRLQDYAVEAAMAIIADGNAILKIDTQHLRDLSFRVGSIYQFIGELHIQADCEAILQARVGRNVDGLDLNLYRQSLQLLRQFQADRMNNTKCKTNKNDTFSFLLSLCQARGTGKKNPLPIPELSRDQDNVSEESKAKHVTTQLHCALKDERTSILKIGRWRKTGTELAKFEETVNVPKAKKSQFKKKILKKKRPVGREECNQAYNEGPVLRHTTAIAKEVNEASGIIEAALMMNNSTLCGSDRILMWHSCDNHKPNRKKKSEVTNHAVETDTAIIADRNAILKIEGFLSCPVLAPTSYIFKNRWMIFLSVKSKVLLIWGLGSSTCRIKSLYLQHKITSQASLKLIFDTLWIGEYVPDCVPRG
ncbi:CST complex subunit TEN1 [Citrus sinensis]|uniref:CST complex subunit TEN1 n=1 Tax=Citrus sinensis TaxID=2711 RepID=A0ACB8KM13_CITSI|nr:CST complex subunit TEN1 [Citrus sinensis]